MADDIEIHIKTDVEGSEYVEALKNLLEELENKANDTGDALSDFENDERGAGDGADELGDKEDEATSSTEALNNVVSGLVAIGLADYFKTSAEAFDNYNLSMSAMTQVANNNGVSLQGVTDGVKAVTDATSIGGGTARQFFTNMMNMGVTNTKALSDTMIGLQGSTVITGGSFDSMKGKLIMMMNSTSLQTRALTGMGLSLTKLAQVNGMSVDQLKASWESFTPDQKLQVLNKGLAQNKGLTEQLAQTSGDKLKEIENSWGALSVAIGASTSGATNAIYDLINNGVQGLTWAVKNVPFMDTFAGIGLGVSSALMSLNPMITTFNQLSTAVDNAKKLMGLLTLENINSSVSTAANTIKVLAYQVALSLGIITKEEYAVATAEATLAEYAFLGPLLLIIGAVVALVGGIYLLGQYMGWWNDWGGFINAVKGKIMQLWNAIVGFGRTVASVIQGAIGKWNQFKSSVANVTNNIRTSIISAWNNIKAKIISLVHNITTGVVNGFKGLVGKVRSSLSGIYNAIASPFQRAYNTVKPLIDGIKAGANAIGNIGSALGISAGFESNISSAGFTTGASLGNIMNNNSKNSTVVNISGIIENDAKEYIVNAVNDRIKKEQIISGVI